jgi:hypothetical protein
MAARELIKKWDTALVLALTARQSELSEEDLEVVLGPDAMALEVRSGLVAGPRGYTKGPSCGCGTLLCSIEYC